MRDYIFSFVQKSNSYRKIGISKNGNSVFFSVKNTACPWVLYFLSAPVCRGLIFFAKTTRHPIFFCRKTFRNPYFLELHSDPQHLCPKRIQEALKSSPFCNGNHNFLFSNNPHVLHRSPSVGKIVFHCCTPELELSERDPSSWRSRISSAEVWRHLWRRRDDVDNSSSDFIGWADAGIWLASWRTLSWLDVTWPLLIQMSSSVESHVVCTGTFAFGLSIRTSEILHLKFSTMQVNTGLVESSKQNTGSICRGLKLAAMLQRV